MILLIGEMKLDNHLTMISVEGKTSYWNIRIYQDQLGYLFVYICVYVCVLCCDRIQLGMLYASREGRCKLGRLIEVGKVDWF